MAEEGSKGPANKGRAPYRLKRWTHIERDLRMERGPLLAGVDEVGRGPIAGPVVAAAVIMPPDMRAIRGVDDSKALTAQERQRLVGRIQERALAWALGAASVRSPAIQCLCFAPVSAAVFVRSTSRSRSRAHHAL